MIPLSLNLQTIWTSLFAAVLANDQHVLRVSWLGVCAIHESSLHACIHQQQTDRNNNSCL